MNTGPENDGLACFVLIYVYLGIPSKARGIMLYL
jgi:hypothetical protein